MWQTNISAAGVRMLLSPSPTPEHATHGLLHAPAERGGHHVLAELGRIVLRNVTVLPDGQMRRQCSILCSPILLQQLLKSSLATLLDQCKTIGDELFAKVRLGCWIMQTGQVGTTANLQFYIELHLVVQHIVGEGTQSFFLILIVRWQCD